MRIPQLYRQPAWQRFIAGFILGTVVGWVLFIILFGMAQERQMEKIREQQVKINNLKDDKKNYMKEAEDKNEKLQNQLTVQDIKIKFLNREEVQLGDSQFSKIEGRIKEQLSSLYNQNIETVAANTDLIYLIENSTYTIEKEKYRLDIQTLVIYSTITISVELKKTKFEKDENSAFQEAFYQEHEP